MYDGENIPEPDTLFDDDDGVLMLTSRHEMGIATDMHPFRLMLEYSSKHTPEQLKAFDDFFRPRNETFRRANLSGDDVTRWNYQRFIKNYLAASRRWTRTSDVSLTI